MPIIGQRNHPKLSKAAGRDFQAVLVEIDQTGRWEGTGRFPLADIQLKLGLNSTTLICAS